MKKSNKGFITYAVMLVIILVIAISLNGSLSNQVNRRIEYPELLTMIENHEVSAVAIRSRISGSRSRQVCKSSKPAVPLLRW